MNVFLRNKHQAEMKRCVSDKDEIWQGISTFILSIKRCLQQIITEYMEAAPLLFISSDQIYLSAFQIFLSRKIGEVFSNPSPSPEKFFEAKSIPVKLDILMGL